MVVIFLAYLVCPSERCYLPTQTKFMHKPIRSHPIQFYSRMLSKRTSKWSWNGISNQHIAKPYFSSHWFPSSVNKSTNKSGLRRHIGFTENFREAAESESHLQYLSAVPLTGTQGYNPWAQPQERRKPEKPLSYSLNSTFTSRLIIIIIIKPLFKEGST